MTSHHEYEGRYKLTENDQDFRDSFPSWNLAELTAPDVQFYLRSKDTVLVPIGSTEQHAQHLPLCTDVITALGVSQRVSSLIAILHTPAIWTGYSPQHMFEPGGGRGTVAVRGSTMQGLLYDVGRSLIHSGFNRLFFVNGHSSNEKIIDPVLRSLRYETGALVSFVNPLMMSSPGLLDGLFGDRPEDLEGWHASAVETSQDLAWNPRLVRMDRARPGPVKTPEHMPTEFLPGNTSPALTFEGHTYFKFPTDYRDNTETGGTGDPTTASAERGEEAFRRFSEHIARGILALNEAKVSIHNREFSSRGL